MLITETEVSQYTRPLLGLKIFKATLKVDGEYSELAVYSNTIEGAQNLANAYLDGAMYHYNKLKNVVDVAECFTAFEVDKLLAA